MISGHGNIETAVAAIKIGAYDFIEKPFKSDRLLLVVERAIEAARLRRENEELKLRAGGDDELVGSSHADRSSCASRSSASAPTGSRVLITGAPGAGKEVVGAPAARALAPRRGAVRRRSTARRCAPSGSRSSCSAAKRAIDAGGPRKIGTFERGAWRHAVPRRGRRHAARDPGQDRARACRSRPSSGSAAAASRSMSASSPPPTATCRPKSPPAASARICYYRLNVVPIAGAAVCASGARTSRCLARHFMERAAEAARSEPARIRRGRDGGAAGL